MDSSTPPGEREPFEQALDLARNELVLTRAPTISGLCERIELHWGERLWDEMDDDAEMLRLIIGNLRWLERRLAC